MIGPNSRNRSSGSPLLLLSLDRDAERPLYEQVYYGIREAILDGTFPSGARLPSTRSLASDLDVSRTTIVLAFDQLRREGYVVGNRGGGTRVRSTLPDELLEVGEPGADDLSDEGEPSSRASAGAETTGEVAGSRLSDRGAALAESGGPFIRRGTVDAVPFQLGVSALDLFPAAEWGRIAGRRWRGDDAVSGHADPAGQPDLRRAIASYLVRARGARCSPDQVIVVNGGQQAVDLAARVLLDPGDAAWIEDPGYFGARLAFVGADVRPIPVPVDDEGIDVEAGQQLEPSARLAYVTPSHQFPLGSVMSASRRLRLLDWARRTDAWIVEDDYDSEFRYEGRPLHCLQGLEAERLQGREPSRVIYVGTFSKTLAPDLRLGYLVVPTELVDAFRAARTAADRCTPPVTQDVLTRFLEDGKYLRHLRRVRAVCAERQSALVTAAGSELDGLLTLEEDPAGLHLVGWLAPGISDTGAAEAAARESVTVSPLSRHRLASSPRSSERDALLLGYAAFDESEIRSGVRRLRRALERYVGA